MTFTSAFFSELDPHGALDFKGELPGSLGLPKLSGYHAFNKIRGWPDR